MFWRLVQPNGLTIALSSYTWYHTLRYSSIGIGLVHEIHTSVDTHQCFFCGDYPFIIYGGAYIRYYAYILIDNCFYKTPYKQQQQTSQLNKKTSLSLSHMCAYDCAILRVSPLRRGCGI